MKVNRSQRDANSAGNCKTLEFVDEEDETSFAQVSPEDNRLLGAQTPCSLVDIRYIGRHYLLKSTSHPSTLGIRSPTGSFDAVKTGIKRHYTEAFCMRANVF